MFTSSPVRDQLYEDICLAAKGMTGNWSRRIAYAEVQRNHFRPHLEAEGLWMPVAAETWMAAFQDDGAKQAAWLDEATLGFLAEQHMGWFWTDELMRRRNSAYRVLARVRCWLARVMEWPVATCLSWVWRA